MEPTGAKSIEWAAGLFEGEGWLSHKADGNWKMAIEMTCSDVMWDWYMAIGCRGNLGGLYKRPSAKPHHKPTMEWRTSDRKLIFELVSELFPYMGNKRRERMVEFLNWYQEKTK